MCTPGELLADICLTTDDLPMGGDGAEVGVGSSAYSAAVLTSNEFVPDTLYT